MVTITSLTQTGLHNWKLKYSSDLEDPVFYIHIDGNLIATTDKTEYDIAINIDEATVIEVLDDPDDQPMQIFPGKLRLGWFFVEGTDHYRVDEYIGSEWVERYEMPENGGYMSWRSRFLEDGQTHLFKVTPIGTDGNEGTAKQFAVLMCRRPDVPDVSYGGYAKKKTVTGTLAPDATGSYVETGTHNGKPYYRREDGSWFIWYEVIVWNITDTLGQYSSAMWDKDAPDINGDYYPVGTASGTATVSAGKGNITITQNQ